MLRFHRVSIYAKVWLNSEFLGGHFDGYLLFEPNLSVRLRADAPNTLVVRVDNRYHLPRRPKAGLYALARMYGGEVGNVE